jgi:hypothetical protein
MGLGISRGTGDSLAAWSGVCRTLRGLADPILPLSTPTGVARSYISEARGRTILRTSPSRCSPEFVCTEF